MRTQIRAAATVGLLVTVLLVGPMTAQGTTVTVSGFLNDPANTALRGSDPAPSPPGFIDDYVIANNVAVYSFNVASAGNVTFESKGYALGGVDPYFTLFSGSDDSATVWGSNYFEPAGDFYLDFFLPAGDYQFALGVWMNMSFAENLGAGTLGEGFIGLGVPGYLGTSYYELVVTTDAAPVPEPATGWLLISGLGGLGWLARRKPA